MSRCFLTPQELIQINKNKSSCLNSIQYNMKGQNLKNKTQVTRVENT